MKYLPTIGIECHVQLKTKTKLFAAVDNNAREAQPNALVSPVCFGLPGVLPVLNEEALRLGIRVGLALNAKINLRSVFDRKHYFYPDLPKGYQISQFHEPIVGQGYLEVPDGNGGYQKIGITRAHLEEDAGKLTHSEGADYSLVDLNRAGTPLIEIVSEPDIHSAAVAKAYAKELFYLMKYAEVSDVDLYHGNMRFDVNISLAPADAKELGIRAEIKNLNSFRSVERAIEYEIKRQSELLDSGKSVVQETRGWDEASQKTYSQRSKEDSHDYRYFPDPDIPPVILRQVEIDQQVKTMPLLTKPRRDKFMSLELANSQIETLIDNKEMGDLVLQLMAKASPEVAKRAANWLCGEVQAELTKNADVELNLDARRLLELAQMVDDDQLNSNGATKVVVAMLSDQRPPETIAAESNLLQVSDSSRLENVVDKVLAANPQAVKDLKAGEKKVMGFIIGQVMKETHGQAKPSLVTEIVLRKLDL